MSIINCQDHKGFNTVVHSKPWPSSGHTAGVIIGLRHKTDVSG